MKEITNSNELPSEITVHIVRDKRFTKRSTRTIVVKSESIIDNKVIYCGKKFTLYKNKFGNFLIYLNEIKKFFGVCEKCQAPDGWNTLGGCYCVACRSQAGNCMLCKRNRIDCCC